MTDALNRVDEELPESESVAEFSIESNSIGSRIAHFLHDKPAVVPLIVLLAATVTFSALIGERFFSAFTLTLILQQVAIVGIVACAQSLVILTAGIDLFVGAIMVLSSVVMGKFTFDLGLPPGLAVLFGLACGLLIGSINGVLVAFVKLPPFIVTLGMWQIALAVNFPYSGSEVIRSQDIAAKAPLLQFFGRTLELGGAIFCIRRRVDVGSGCGSNLRAQPDRMGAPRICGGR